MEATERPVVLAIAAVAVTGLLAAAVLAWYAFGLRGRVIILEAALTAVDQRLELAEKGLQSVAAGQAELVGRVEQQMLSGEGLEKRVRRLEEVIQALEQALQGHAHDSPQLG